MTVCDQCGRILNGTEYIKDFQIPNKNGVVNPTSPRFDACNEECKADIIRIRNIKGVWNRRE